MNLIHKARSFHTVCCRYRMLVLVLSAALSGCTNTLLVEGDFPSPLVNKIPIKVGIHYSDRFSNYQYVEQSEDRGKWIIIIGEAQENMFSTVLAGMFDEVQEIDSLPPYDESLGVDLVISPLVDEFQYTLPAETKIKVYEIWLKYNVRVYQKGGGLLADWILTAYGKTPEGFMQSDESALNQAVVVALRDAGANLSLNFSRIPEVRNWLGER